MTRAYSESSFIDDAAKDEAQRQSRRKPTATQVIAGVAGAAALVSGCAAGPAFSTSGKAKPAHVITVGRGNAVDIPYTVPGPNYQTSPQEVRSPFVLRAQRVGQRITFQVLAGHPGEAKSVLLDKSGADFMVAGTKSEEHRLEREGFNPYDFSVRTVNGDHALYEFSLPGQPDEEVVDVQTSEGGVTSISVAESSSELTPR